MAGGVGSWLLNRLSWALRAGLQFQGKRDLYAVFGWRYKLQYSDFLIKYARQGAAQRLIDYPVTSTWLPQPDILADDAFATAWEDLCRQISIWSIFVRADRMCGIGRYSALFVGYDDVRSPQDLALPVKAGESRKVLYMQPYGEDVVAIAQYEKNPQSPRFGKPLMYSINMQDPSILSPSSVIPLNADAKAFKFKAVKVHHSRVIHIAEPTLDDDTYGVPRLMSAYNDLDDLLKVTGGSSETFWLTSNRGMQMDVDKEMELNPTDAAALEAEAEDYQHELRRIIRTRGVKITELGSQTANPSNAYKVLLSQLAIQSGIPVRLLMGSEAGQLASEIDRTTWAALINVRRLNFAEPCVLFPFINHLVSAGALPTPQVLEIEWQDAFNLSPLEKAQTMAQTARSAVNLSKQFQDGKQPITSLDEARRILDLTTEADAANLDAPSGPGQTGTEGAADTAPDMTTPNPPGTGGDIFSPTNNARNVRNIRIRNGKKVKIRKVKRSMGY